MKQIKTTLLAGAILVGIAVQSHAQVSASVGADVASAYIYRGATLNDGFVFQPGIEVGGLGGFTFGVWGNLDIDALEDVSEDDDGNIVKNSLDSQFSEIDLYASYGINLDGVGIDLGYTEYTYPYASGARVDADRELSASAGISLPLGENLALDPTITLFYGLEGGLEDVIQADLNADIALPLVEQFGLDLSARLGYVIDEGEDGSYYTDSGMRDLTITGATSLTDWLNLGLTYVVETDDDVQPVDEDFYVTLGAAKEF